MKTKDSFVYCWTDHKTGMLYVGSHKGTIDDGYVCSSPNCPTFPQVTCGGPLSVTGGAVGSSHKYDARGWRIE
jgi:hypothetical protein